MLKLVLKAALYAAALLWLIPALGIGVAVHGDFVTALGLAVVFAAVSWCVIKLVQLAVVFTLGLAGCLFLLLFWLVPALCLHFTSELLPQYLTIDGTGAAIFGGIVLMVMSILAELLAPTRSNS